MTEALGVHILPANKFHTLWERTKVEIPGARIIRRDKSKLIKALFFWGGKRYDSFGTTIGRTIYVATDWEERVPDEQYLHLRHELVHLRQFRRWPFRCLDRTGLWRINALIYGLCYLLVLPILWTFRAYFERAGYEQTMLTVFELGWTQSSNVEHLAYWQRTMVKTFSTSKYIWMAPSWTTKRWVKRVFQRHQDGKLVNNTDRVE